MFKFFRALPTARMMHFASIFEISKRNVNTPRIPDAGTTNTRRICARPTQILNQQNLFDGKEPPPTIHRARAIASARTSAGRQERLTRNAQASTHARAP